MTVLPAPEPQFLLITSRRHSDKRHKTVTHYSVHMEGFSRLCFIFFFFVSVFLIFFWEKVARAEGGNEWDWGTW